MTSVNQGDTLSTLLPGLPLATPYTATLLCDVVTPIALFAQLASDARHACLLESTEGDTRLARFSVLGVNPRWVLTVQNGTTQLLDGVTETPQLNLADANPLDVMRQVMRQTFPQKPSAPPHIGPLPFLGGWMGYMGYGLTGFTDDISQQAERLTGLRETPDVQMGFYDSFFVMDHLYRRLHFISWKPHGDAELLWHYYQEQLAKPVTLPPLAVPGDVVARTLDETGLDPNVTPVMDQATFEAAVLGCKELILDGEVFQIVLANAFTRPVQADPMTVYRYVQALNPSPYGFLLRCPQGDYLGASPETFVQCVEGNVRLKSLAGTRPRGKTPQQDAEHAASLQADPKELAEHRMLVDLSRNDLGRVCHVGSVHTGPIAELVNYTHVMHLSTDIYGQVRPPYDSYDVIASCFPRDTVTGAPKIRAMQHLSRLEPFHRGLYSGMVGYLDCRDNLDGCIAIRSAFFTRHGTTSEGRQAIVQAGAGIVHDSRPDMEFLETCNKARSILKAIALAETATGATP